MMDLHRGDICLVNFNPAQNGEIGKLRPAIVLSSALDNEILDTVIVVPLSTMIEKNALPYRLFLHAREKLHKDCDVCIYEIRALSKSRVKEYLARVSDDELETIQHSLCEILK